jgi:hypothetical protein
MNCVKSDEIVNKFKLLNEGKVEYVLMRNINNELPHDLEIGKDIDILVKDRNMVVEVLKKNNFNKINHPHENNLFLYGVEKFEFYKNNENILFDLNFQIAVRSLDAGQWIPLDQAIQESAWQNKRFERAGGGLEYWTLSYEDEFVALIARSVFDKKEFQAGYISRLDELLPMVNKDNVLKKLQFIFFKYAPLLLYQIERQNYPDIVINYLKFKEY